MVLEPVDAVALERLVDDAPNAGLDGAAADGDTGVLVAAVPHSGFVLDEVVHGLVNLAGASSHRELVGVRHERLDAAGGVMLV